MRYCFLLNPAAGKGGALRLRPAIEAAFRGRDTILQITRAPGEAEAFVREECRRCPGDRKSVV